MVFIYNGPENAAATILLAHGAGAPMDSAAMSAVADALASSGFRVARFEFAYMAARRDGQRKPPPKAELLRDEYKNAVRDIGDARPLIIGGKSMGGRVASLVADELFADARIAGLLCLGYPFHPPAKPDQLRTAHLGTLKTPTLICQGTRDPFGTRDEVEGHQLSDRIDVLWLEDGDHELKPRKKITGLSVEDHLQSVGVGVAEWAHRIVP
jgi:predicted alpha/beta-hydrolase family hydrolase